jgi:hypothetical protein
MGFHDWGMLVDVIRHGWLHALVFRVRFTTVPALIMRSNSKQPFWLTGDMMSTLVMPCLVVCKWGVSSFMPAERMAIGLACVCWPSSVAAMTVGGAFKVGGVCVLGSECCYVPGARKCYGDRQLRYGIR